MDDYSMPARIRSLAGRTLHATDDDDANCSTVILTRELGGCRVELYGTAAAQHDIDRRVHPGAS
jgi:hypothetical protein